MRNFLLTVSIILGIHLSTQGILAAGPSYWGSQKFFVPFGKWNLRYKDNTFIVETTDATHGTRQLINSPETPLDSPAELKSKIQKARSTGKLSVVFSNYVVNFDLSSGMLSMSYQSFTNNFTNPTSDYLPKTSSGGTSVSSLPFAIEPAITPILEQRPTRRGRQRAALSVFSKTASPSASVELIDLEEPNDVEIPGATLHFGAIRENATPLIVARVDQTTGVPKADVQVHYPLGLRPTSLQMISYLKAGKWLLIAGSYYFVPAKGDIHRSIISKIMKGQKFSIYSSLVPLVFHSSREQLSKALPTKQPDDLDDNTWLELQTLIRENLFPISSCKTTSQEIGLERKTN